MVLYEMMDNKNFRTTHRETIKFTEAVDILNILKKHSKCRWFNITNVQVFCPFTENRVVIRTTGKADYFMKLTYKQFKKVEDLLVELNNGEPVEKCWYH